MLQVASLHKIVPDGRSLPDGYRNGTQDTGLVVPMGGNNRYNRQPTLGGHIFRRGPTSKINGDAIGERVAPLKPILARDKGEHQMIGKIAAILGVWLFGKQLQRESVALSRQPFRPSFLKIMDDGGDGSLPVIHPHDNGPDLSKRLDGRRFGRSSLTAFSSLWNRRRAALSHCAPAPVLLLTGKNLGLPDRLRQINGNVQGCDIRKLRLQVVIDVRVRDVDPSRAGPKRQSGHIAHMLLTVVRGVLAFHPDYDLFISAFLNADLSADELMVKSLPCRHQGQIRPRR